MARCGLLRASMSRRPRTDTATRSGRSGRDVLAARAAPLIAARALLAAALLALTAALLAPPAGAQEAVVHPAVTVTQLQRNAIRAIFGMRLRVWPDGTPIRVFVMEDESPVHARFLKEKLHLFPHQLRRAWDRLIYTGTGQAPTIVRSEAEMRRRVASTRGAIGYLRQQTIDDSVQVVELTE